MAKMKEWIAIILIMFNFQLILSGQIDENTKLVMERLDSVEAAQEFHGLKMEYIESEMKGFKKKMESLEIKDRDILGDLSKLDKIVAGLGVSVSSFISPRDPELNKQTSLESFKNQEAIEESNKIKPRPDDKEDCLYELKTWNDTCLVAPDGINTIPTHFGSYLAELPCKSVKKEQQWKRKDMHICSYKNDKCLTVSPDYKVGGFILNLMAYEALAKSQQWIIGSTMTGFNLIVNVETSLCLFDPLYDYTKKVSATASTTVQSCGRVNKECLFSFALVNRINLDKCPLVRIPDVEEDIKKQETLKLKMGKYVSKMI